MFESVDRVIERTAQQKKLQAEDQAVSSRHRQLLADNEATRKMMIQIFHKLVDYLEGHTGKTEIVNQLKSINTPDALEVARAVNSLHQTLKGKDVDLSEITEVMKQVLAETKTLPKDIAKLEIPEKFSIENMQDYSGDFKALLEAVKAIKLVAKAPDVHLSAPDVHVAAPDLNPLEKATKAVEKAIKGLTIPEPASLSEVEKLLNKANKLLKEIADKPVARGGGGGGGRVSPFSDGNNMPQFVGLQQGALPTLAAPLAQRIDSPSATVSYIGYAAPGTLTSAAAWQIRKIDETTGTIINYADGNANFDNVWDNRAALTYS